MYSGKRRRSRARREPSFANLRLSSKPKSTEEQNVRLTTGLSAVYPRDDGLSSFLAADQWTDAYLSL